MVFSSERSGIRIGQEVDLITYEVVRSSLTNLVDVMGRRLRRVAFSPVITEGCDYTLAVCDAEGDVVACGSRDLPAHLGTLEFTVRAVLAKYDLEDIRDGDFYFLNDPHAAGSHNNDVRVLAPFYFDASLVGWVVSCGHWTDVGGPFPGSFNPDARSCFAEGLRIPATRLVRGGVVAAEVVDLVLGNLRTPSQARGDLQAQIEACRAGLEGLRHLCERYGASVVETCFAQMMMQSEHLFLEQAAARLAMGTFEFSDCVDEDSAVEGSGPIWVRLKLTVARDHLTFDFRGSDPAPTGPSGNPLPMTWSAVICATLNFLPGVPFNHGIIRCISVLVDTPSCVSVAFPGPVCATGSGVYMKAEACALNCLGQADPANATGCTYNLQNLTIGGRRQDGSEWVMYLWTVGGFGGSARGDGGIPSMMLFAAGTKTQPVEVLERTNPILFERVAIAPDSMGAGKFCGGPAEERVFVVRNGEATLTAIGDRFRHPIWGVCGGGPGKRQEIVVDFGSSNERCVGVSVSGINIRPGCRVYLRSGGGGGFGVPLERAAEMVLRDIERGWVTKEAAEASFGVVLREDPSASVGVAVDQAGTVALRRNLAKGV